MTSRARRQPRPRQEGRSACRSGRVGSGRREWDGLPQTGPHPPAREPQPPSAEAATPRPTEGREDFFGDGSKGSSGSASTLEQGSRSLSAAPARPRTPPTVRGSGRTWRVRERPLRGQQLLGGAPDHPALRLSCCRVGPRHAGLPPRADCQLLALRLRPGRHRGGCAARASTVLARPRTPTRPQPSALSPPHRRGRGRRCLHTVCKPATQGRASRGSPGSDGNELGACTRRPPAPPPRNRTQTRLLPRSLPSSRLPPERPASRAVEQEGHSRPGRDTRTRTEQGVGSSETRAHGTHTV